VKQNQQQQHQLDEILTTEEVAKHLKLPPSTIVLLCARGEIPGARKVGRRWRIPAWECRRCSRGRQWSTSRW